jgi:hypothetical protein
MEISRRICVQPKQNHCRLIEPYKDEILYYRFEYSDRGYCPEREAKILKELKTGNYYDNLIDEDTHLWIPLKNGYYEQLCKKKILKCKTKLQKIFRGSVNRIKIDKASIEGWANRPIPCPL